MPLPASGPTLTKFAAEYVERRSPSWKPSTVKATISYLNSAILPALGHPRVGSVVRADIARFFHEYGQRKPGGADRSHDILRNMFDCAISWGHRPEAAGNPCTGIVRYRRPPRGRLLGADDLAKLGATLRRLEIESPVHAHSNFPRCEPLRRSRPRRSGECRSQCTPPARLAACRPDFSASFTPPGESQYGHRRSVTYYPAPFAKGG